MTDPDERVARTVAAAHHQEWTRVMAATVRTVRDLDLAQECVQEAYAEALEQWPAAGVPDNPGAWLTTTARRRALDAVRRESTLRGKLPLLLWPDDSSPAAAEQADTRVADEDEATVLDEQLRLIFLCCHPALAPESRHALTLRLVCGVSTADIAQAFLVPTATMAARLTRAKRKIAVSRIPCAVPDQARLPGRLDDVLDVISVLLATGHAPPTGETGQRVDLVDDALRLAETVHALLPHQSEATGALAQALLVTARSSTRTDDAGRPVPLREQDRSRWDRARLDRAHDLVVGAMSTGGHGPFVLRAAIMALLSRPQRWGDVDWAEVVQLYDALLRVDPSPVVALNRAVALAEVDGPQVALAVVERLAAGGTLPDYRYLHATRAELLRRIGRPEWREAAEQAVALAHNEAEREVLASWLAEGSSRS